MAPTSKESKKAAPPKVTFKQDGKDFKFLVTLFKKGQIKANEKPGNVRSKYLSQFGKYTGPQFRAQYSKARTLSGVSGTILTPTLTTVDSSMLTQILFAVSPIEDDDDVDEASDGELDTPSVVVPSVAGTNDAVVDGDDTPTGWVPKKIVCEYTNRDNIPCMAMLIPLTGGAYISQQSDVEVKLVDNGWTVIVIERWTYHYADMKDYYSRHPRELDVSDEDWVRRSLAMNDEIERIKLAASHGLVSIYRHRLPWKAAEVVDQITGTTDGARTCHIDVYSKRRIQEKKIFIADSKKSKGKARGIFQDSPSANYSLVNE